MSEKSPPAEAMPEHDGGKSDARLPMNIFRNVAEMFTAS
jgi:hypothetical protein